MTGFILKTPGSVFLGLPSVFYIKFVLIDKCQQKSTVYDLCNIHEMTRSVVLREFGLGLEY